MNFIVYKSKNGLLQMDQLDNLIYTIGTKIPRLGSPLVKTSPIFAYVRSGCHYSQEACHILQCEGFTDTRILNIWCNPKPAFVHIDDFYKVTDEEIPKKLLDAVQRQQVLSDTVPQIFAFQDGKWAYVGGCDDLKETHIVSAKNAMFNQKLATESSSSKNSTNNLKW